MKNKNFVLKIIGAALLFIGFSAAQAFAQPSAAQIKKQLTSAKTVSITLGSPGTIEWSSTYKKYIWTRYFTVKLKTDTPGEILVVKGYAAYDVMGGRYVYWRTFTSGNNYEGKKNPTVAEINQALQTENDISGFTNGQPYNIGEYESFRIAPDADWEWHTTDSVSFNVVAVFHRINNGKHYDNEPRDEYRQGFKKVDNLEQMMRLRLYRQGANLPWSSVGVSERIRDPEDRRYLKEVIKLLERKILPEAEVEQMPRMSKVPTLMN